MSASARTARLRDKVLSRGFKVQNTNHTLSTSNMRGVVPCKTNFDQITYTLPKCQIYLGDCNDIKDNIDDNTYTQTPIKKEDIKPVNSKNNDDSLNKLSKTIRLNRELAASARTARLREKVLAIWNKEPDSSLTSEIIDDVETLLEFNRLNSEFSASVRSARFREKVLENWTSDNNINDSSMTPEMIQALYESNNNTYRRIPLYANTNPSENEYIEYNSISNTDNTSIVNNVPYVKETVYETNEIEPETIRLSIDGGLLARNDYRIRIIGGNPESRGIVVCDGGGP